MTKFLQTYFFLFFLILIVACNSEKKSKATKENNATNDNEQLIENEGSSNKIPGKKRVAGENTTPISDDADSYLQSEGDAVQSKDFSISGTISGGHRATITLDKIGVGLKDYKPLFNQIINEDGEFGFNLTAPEPGLYQLRLPTGMIHVVVNGGEDIVVHSNIDEPWNYEVLNSPQSKDLLNFYLILEDANEKKAVQREKLSKMRNKVSAKEYINYSDNIYPIEVNKIETAKQKQVLDFVTKHKQEFVGLLAANYINVTDYTTFVENYLQETKPLFGNHPFYSGIATKVQPLINLLPGKKAPEIVLENTDGKQVRLSQLQGKYVLLDFWASWCQPCRNANPKIKEIYEKYKSKNFEIFAVSLDNVKNEWVRAINQDELPWVHASDLMGYNSDIAKTYAISAIPTTYLLNKEGIVIAKNLDHNQLEKKLKELTSSGSKKN